MCGMEKSLGIKFKLSFAGFAFAAALPSLALEVYFLRHGETTWNRSKVLQGAISHPDLTDRGARMAEATARGFADAGIKFDRIYASPLKRALHTAEIVGAPKGRKPIVDSRLREMCYGRYDGVRYAKGDYIDDNLRRFFEDPETYVPTGKGAESFDDVGRRVLGFLNDELLPLDGKVDRVLCVAHSLILKMIVRELAGPTASEAARKPIQRNCCVHVLGCANGKFFLKETGRLFYDPAVFDAVDATLMVAHRGAGDLDGCRPEASRAAYSNAVAMACDVVKLDVQRTRDGVVVMSHDPTLKRNMGWDARIADLDYVEILEKGRYFGPGRRPGGPERIVRLDEALAIVKVLPQFWLDFKHFDPDFAERALACFSDAGIDPSRIMVATFSKKALGYLKERHPEIRRVGHVDWRELPGGGFTGGNMTHEDFAGKDELRKGILAYCGKFGLYGVNAPCSRTSGDDVAFLHGSGLKWVSLYFVQDAETARRRRTAGADAYVTDHVTMVREGLAAPCRSKPR